MAFGGMSREGPLISYGPDAVDVVRRSARYADRILKGEKPAELPVQSPVKYELAINLKTARALGLTFRRFSPAPTRSIGSKLIRGLLSETAAGFRSRQKTVMTEPPSPLTMLFRDIQNGASSSRCSAARRRRGRSRRGRSRASGCGASACSWPAAADDPDAQARIAAFVQGLQQLGWTDGRNVRIDYRWGRGQCRHAFARYAAELVALAPDVILATGAATVAPLLQATPHRADRVRECRRSGRRRLRREPGAAGRQRHRLHPVRIRLEREMAGAAQADRAAA